MILKKISKRKLFLLFGDIFLIILSINIAFIIRLKKTIISYLGLNEAIMIILLMLIICLISFYSFDLYNIKEKFIRTRSLVNLVGSLILASLISIGLFYVFPYVIGRGIFLISLVLIGVLVTIWRLSYSFFFSLTVPGRNVLIVGTGNAAKAIYLNLKENPEYKVVGFINDNPNIKESSYMKILGNSLSLEKIAEDQNINDIVVTSRFTSNKKLDKALVKCKMKGISIYDIARFYEYLMGKLPIDHVKERWLLYSNGFGKLGSKINKRLKRILDIIICSFILIISFPIGIIITFIIKVSSKGPLFLIQERTGKNNKPFNLIKFRTMISDAEKGEPKWASENDPRITKFGKILRKTRLDEMPQLINVLKGEMSIIGPRPEREFFIKKLMERIPFYSLRFSVKPGLTGWAQVNYKYGASEKDAIEKLQYDLYYVKNMSFFLDFRILLKTIRIVIFGMGR